MFPVGPTPLLGRRNDRVGSRSPQLLRTLQNIPGGELPVRRFQEVLSGLDVFFNYQSILSKRPSHEANTSGIGTILTRNFTGFLQPLPVFPAQHGADGLPYLSVVTLQPCLLGGGKLLPVDQRFIERYEGQRLQL